MKILIFGANSTIAKELQRIWASQGHSLLLIGRNLEQTEKIAADLNVRGASAATPVIKDLLDFKDADAFVQKLWQQYQGFDLVFMAHGLLGTQKKDEQCTIDTFKILDSNFNSHCAFLTPIANLMEQRKKGIIAVITSVAGDRGKQSNYIYCAAKAGKIAFLSGLRNRLFSSGVSVVELRLGFVDTAMTAELKKGALWVKPDKIAQAIDTAIEKKKDIVYLPKIWFLIMMIIKNIPEFIFKRLKL